MKKVRNSIGYQLYEFVKNEDVSIQQIKDRFNVKYLEQLNGYVKGLARLHPELRDEIVRITDKIVISEAKSQHK
mgnify:CR=1 FL=1